MSIGTRIKEARKNKGLSQAELARLLDVSQGAIGNYESEFSNPKESILWKLMEVLEVDANYLFQDMVDFSVKKKNPDSKVLATAFYTNAIMYGSESQRNFLAGLESVSKNFIDEDWRFLFRIASFMNRERENKEKDED